MVRLVCLLGLFTFLSCDSPAIDGARAHALVSEKHALLLDVRTAEERATAQIPGTTLVDPQVAAGIEKLPKDAMLVFHCHHGGRSQQAAEHFRALGFSNVYNVAGGIDAWSQQVDSSVPRY